MARTNDYSAHFISMIHDFFSVWIHWSPETVGTQTSRHAAVLRDQGEVHTSPLNLLDKKQAKLDNNNTYVFSPTEGASLMTIIPCLSAWSIISSAYG